MRRDFGRKCTLELKFGHGCSSDSRVPAGNEIQTSEQITENPQPAPSRIGEGRTPQGECRDVSCADEKGGTGKAMKFGMSHRRTLLRPAPGICKLAAAGVLSLVPATQAAAQFDDNPVYVDDSPQAWELFHQAAAQEEDNPGESARIYQELLDRYAFKLIPRSDAERDLFDSVRSRVHRALLSAPEVLERYRSIETPQALRLLESGDGEALLTTRFLTAPAVRAALLEAQREFESAHFERALAILTELEPHPDLIGREAGYRWFMLALCANALSNSVLRQVAVDALATSEDSEWRGLHDDVIRLLTAGPGPETQRGLTVTDRAPNAQPAAISGAPIWTVPLTTSLYNRRFSQEINGRNLVPGIEANLRTGELLTTVPTVAGQHVFINEGETIRAFDRFSQREFWKREIAEPMIEAGRGTSQIGDMNLIAVSGNRLVTITGHAGAQERRGSGRVICLDARTGNPYWSVSFERLLGSEEFEGLYPYGAPVIADGVVYVQARKASRQVLMSTYLVALNLDATLASERVRWVRYIASAGGLQNSIMRPYSTLQYRDGELYVATPLGAVAAIDALRGETQWLRRLPAPLSTSGTPPWEMMTPYIAEEELFTITPDLMSILVFDRATGVETARLDAQQFGAPRYLLGGGDMLYAIGNQISAHLLSSPSVCAWAHGAEARTSEPLPPHWEYDLRGRVQLAGDILVAPTQHGVAFYDGQTGAHVKTIETEGAGNPLCLEAELFLAQNDALAAYIPLAVAEANLREQIRAAPANPQPALSLLRLAARSTEEATSLDLALEAADLAAAALQRMTDEAQRVRAQEELFDTLLSVALREETLEYERGGELYGRIGAIAANPRQRIEHLLAKGDSLARAARDDEAHLAAAVESYQTILEQPALAVAERRGQDIIQPAVDVAMQRLASVIEEFGPHAYEPYAETASREFAELPVETTPQEFLAMARKYPFAEASRVAARQAAASLAARGDARGALAAVRDLAGTASPDEQPDIFGSIIDLAIDHGWHDLALAWARRARDAHGMTEVAIDGSRHSIVEILTDLGPAARVYELASIERMLVGSETVLPALDGRLLTSVPGTTPPAHQALMMSARELHRYDTALESPTWLTTLPESMAEILDHWPGAILLSMRNPNGELILLDEESGQRIWASEPYRLALPQLRGSGARLRGAVTLDLPGGAERVDAAEVLTFPTDADVVVVGRSGGAARQRFADPSDRSIWRKDHPLYVVHYAARHDLALVLAGPRAGDERDPSGAIVLIDAEIGEILQQIEPIDGGEVHWMTVTDFGTLVFGSDRSIEAFDLVAGRRLWANTSRDAAGFTRVWSFDNHVYIADMTSRLHAIDLTTGELSLSFEPPPSADGPTFELIDLHASEDDVMAQYRERIVKYRPDGSFIAQDAVVGDRDFQHVIPLAGGGALAVSHVVSTDPAELRRRTAYSDRMYLLSSSCMILDDFEMPAERDPLIGVQVIDGWILLSQRQQTIAVPVR